MGQKLNVLNLRLILIFFVKNEDQARIWCANEMYKPSSLGGEKEGFVFRTQDRFESFDGNIAKYVRKGHIQTGKRREWKANWKKQRIELDFRMVSFCFFLRERREN